MADPSDDIEVPGLGAEEDAMDEEFTNVDVKKEKDLTGDGGLIKKIIKEGTGWETPSKDDSVTVHYHGTLEDGTVFDSSRDRDDPFVFTIGQGQVIKGWDKGVITMKKGELALLTCKADYAYGEAGSSPKIPPNATLQFEVELLSWKSIKDIAGDGGIIKTIETEGKGWEKPKDKDEALVKYAVRAAGSGTAVVASPEEGAVLHVGSGQPVKAFQVALKSMKQGEKASLKIKPEYGFASPQEGVPEGAALEADLELITIRKVEDVTEDGKVVTKLVRKGKDYKRPNEGATVKVAYTGRIGGPDGPVFEEHSKESPLEFVTDEDGVVEGLDLAVMKHNEEEAFEVSVAPEYGFGSREEQRALATVPPNSQLHYAVEVLEVQKAKESWDLSKEEKVELAKKRKEQGNALFKAGKWARAISKYKSAADTVGYDKDFSEDLKRECAAIKKSADLNKAAASLKLHDYKDAISAASKVLETEPGNVKALYRRAQGYLAEQDFVEAELDIRAALLAEPANKDVRALKTRYKKEAAAANAKDRAMYQRAFQKLAKMPDTSTKMPDTDPKMPETEPMIPDSDPKPEPQSHPIDIMDSAASEALMVDVPEAADSPAENGTLHADVNGTDEAAAASPRPMAIET